MPGAELGDPCANLVTDLTSHRFAIQPDFLTSREVAALRACAGLRDVRGEFVPAKVGGQGARQRLPRIRGDYTCWLSKPLFPAEGRAMQALEGLRQLLNRELQLGLFEVEAHYAQYPPGAHYVRHVDRPASRGPRMLTFVLYLNLEWTAQAGGELRLFTDDRVHDIEPIGGRLVCFLTEAQAHEVLPATRARLALTGWFLQRA